MAGPDEGDGQPDIAQEIDLVHLLPGRGRQQTG